MTFWPAASALSRNSRTSSMEESWTTIKIERVIKIETETKTKRKGEERRFRESEIMCRLRIRKKRKKEGNEESKKGR